MPAGVRVTSIAPEIDARNRFLLKVQVQGETRDPAVQLLRNMEKSPHFRSPQFGQENRDKEGVVKSDIITSYLPHTAIEGSE